MKPTCQNCAYWNGIENGLGQCRAEPPKAVFPAVPLDARQIGEPRWVFGSVVWPITRTTDWCGCHDDGCEGETRSGLAEN